MVGTGHQYIVLAVCSLTVNHISLSKTHDLLYFCPQLDLLEVFPLFIILLFYTALWTQDLFVKASGDISLFHNTYFEKFSRWTSFCQLNTFHRHS